MDIIPLGLFLLGVIFLFIGWRWQNPRSEENLVALKGLAYLRSEILRVQDQVHVLEDELLETKRLSNIHVNQTVVDQKALDIEKKDHKEAAPKELELKETEHIQQAKLYSISPQEQREGNSKASKRLFDEKTESMRLASDSPPQAEYHISGKFREVLELAANGQRIPEISQRLFISQDAVRMVLSMKSKGGAR